MTSVSGTVISRVDRSRDAGAFRRRRMALRILAYLALGLAAFTMLVPFLWMLSTSLKTAAATFVYPPQWISSPLVWENYVDVFRALPFGRYMLNTAFVAGTVTVLQIAVASLAAFAFARLRFPGRDALFLAYLATLMVPGQVTIIPDFLIVRTLGWIDTYQGLIIPQVFAGSPSSAFATFLLRQFFMGIPRELVEAARIDGATTFGIFRRIIMPLSSPVLATLGVFTFTGQWNNFLWPLIIVNDDNLRTLTVGLRALVGEFTVDYQLLMAGTVMSLIPMVLAFVFLQRYFVRGIALTGLGGR